MEIRERKVKKINKEIDKNFTDKVQYTHKNRNCCDQFCSIQ